MTTSAHRLSPSGSVGIGSFSASIAAADPAADWVVAIGALILRAAAPLRLVQPHRAFGKCQTWQINAEPPEDELQRPCDPDCKLLLHRVGLRGQDKRGEVERQPEQAGPYEWRDHNITG